MPIDIYELRPAVEAAGLNAISMQEVLELLDRLEAAEKDSSHHKALAVSALRVAKGWEAKCNELRAKIEAMERQEPVASVWRCDNGHIHGSCEKTLPMGAKLYARTGAQGE